MLPHAVSVCLTLSHTVHTVSHCLILSHKFSHFLCAGVLDKTYHPSDIYTPDSNTTTAAMCGLESVYEDFTGWSKEKRRNSQRPLRTLVTMTSGLGGQGFIKCSCRKGCTASCGCRAHNPPRRCTSKCACSRLGNCQNQDTPLGQAK